MHEEGWQSQTLEKLETTSHKSERWRRGACLPATGEPVVRGEDG